MYGNIVPAGENHLEVFNHGVPIPIEIIKNKPIMNMIRSYTRYNPDLPGNIQDIHPMKFTPDLTPIEELRFTPITPISEKDVLIHKKQIEERKLRSQFFEVDRKVLMRYALYCIFAFGVWFVFKYVNGRTERFNYEIEKRRLKRYRYREDDDFY